MAVNKAKLAEIKQAESIKLDKLIKQGQWTAFEQEVQRLCGVIVLKDDLLEEDFINQIKQNKLDTFGNYELRASGKAYYVDFKAEVPKEKDVTTSCGKVVKIKYVVCNEPYDSQVVTDYTDILDVNIQKQLPITISKAELRKIACGQDTYDALVDLVRSKVQEATYDLIYNEVMCRLNDPSNYKQIAEIKYCCNRCEGKDFMSALNNFALKLQRNTAPFTIAGRDYNLSIKKMWLLKSYDLDSRMGSVLSQRAGDRSYIDINSKFENTWPLDLSIADGIIVDNKAIQVHEVLNEVDWKYDAHKRSECGVANYDARVKLVVFSVAVPFKLVKVDCEAEQEANNLAEKIESATKEYTITDQADAETQIKADIEAMKQPESKLELTYTFSEFKAPTDADGSIKVEVSIKDVNGTELSTANNTYVLKKKITKPLSDKFKEPDLSALVVPVPTNDDEPLASQIAESAINETKNKEAGLSINDFNIAQDSVKVINKPKDPEGENPYVNGDYTAVATGVGDYVGTIDIKGKFGRLNP